MKATLSCLATLLALAVPAARGGDFRVPPQAPDACGPGYYNVGPCGMVYGPNYYLQPCFLPYQGAVFGPKAPPGYPGAGAGFPGAGPGAPGLPAVPGAPGAAPGFPFAPPSFPTH